MKQDRPPHADRITRLGNIRVCKEITLVMAGILGLSLPAVLFAQHAPPTLQSVTPNGAQRGVSVTVLVDGTNLSEAQDVFFNVEGVRCTILDNRQLPNIRTRPKIGDTFAFIDDGSSRNRLRVQMEFPAETKPGVYLFRLLTPLGSTNPLTFEVGAFPEITETQLNSRPDQAQPVQWPATIQGDISEPGDVDYFVFDAQQGAELVFQLFAAALGSSLNSRIRILDETGNVRAENDNFRGRDSLVVFSVPEAGRYTVEVSDAQFGGGGQHHYRLRAGEFPLVTDVFPLGLRGGEKTTVEVRGANLGELTAIPVQAESGGWGETVTVPVPPAWNDVRLAVGRFAETLENEPNDSPAEAARMDWPVTINGRIGKPDSEGVPAGSDADYYRFHARRDEQIVFEVEAERLGSGLDSVIEVLDASANSIPRATVRCVAQTEVALRDHDARSSGIRFVNPDDFKLYDYVMIGGEILQVDALPRFADEDVVFRSFNGSRIPLFDTTAEGHALGDPIYKVEIAPPGTRFPPNGMPVFTLSYRNDDGGPLLGTDSRLTFTAPYDGEFLVRVQDVLGFAGRDEAYRLTVRRPQPDFKLMFATIQVDGRFGRFISSREHVNLAPGSQVPVNVVAYRLDGFEGEIEVSLDPDSLPEGVTATAGVIPVDSDYTVLVVSAAPDARFDPVPLSIAGRARIGDEWVEHALQLDNRLVLLAPSLEPDIQVQVSPSRVEISPGSEVVVTVRLDRRQGFDARVPIDLRNLPEGVRVQAVGLNGIMVTENESTRTFTLYAEPWVRPARRSFFTVGRIETNTSIPLEFTSAPIELVVQP